MVYCPFCKRDFELRQEIRKVDCKHCRSNIKLNEKNAVYYIEYHHEHRRIREKVGFNRKFAEMVLSKRKIEIAENKFLDKKQMANIEIVLRGNFQASCFQILIVS